MFVLKFFQLIISILKDFEMLHFQISRSEYLFGAKVEFRAEKSKNFLN